MVYIYTKEAYDIRCRGYVLPFSVNICTDNSAGAFWLQASLL